MTWVIVVVAVLAVLAVAAVVLVRARSAALKRRFGPEYDRVVDETGDRRAGEAELRDRARRRAALELHELSPEAHERYLEEWRDAQHAFVDDPHRAVADADALVQRVMRDRGFPADGFDERVEMVSVDRPQLAEQYRAAHAIQRRDDAETASTEELRDAFRRYRALFDDLVDDGPGGADVADEHTADDEREPALEDDRPERGSAPDHRIIRVGRGERGEHESAEEASR
jgi:hypothetical protein